MKGYVIATIDIMNDRVSVYASNSIEKDELKEIRSMFESNRQNTIPQLFEEMSKFGYNIESVNFKNYGDVFIFSRAIDEI